MKASGEGKIRLLRRLFSEGFLNAVTLEELKLYLMLLVGAEPLEEEQTIDPRTVGRALGREINPMELLQIARRLEDRSLVHIRLDVSTGQVLFRYRLIFPRSWHPTPTKGA
ncbi:MAG: hypothetical protein ACE5I9_11465 [Candidatus Methylomirabilales bacterium]